jgi:hypothetical protein
MDYGVQDSGHHGSGLQGWDHPQESYEEPSGGSDSTIRPLRPKEVASVPSGSKYKIEARGFGERSKVPVPRDERNASVDTALGD